MKKFFAILMSLALMLSLAVPAMAADITISGGATGSVYAAYKLLDATDGGDGKYAYTLNDKYDDILKVETGKSELADIIAYIQALKDEDGEEVRDFADDVYVAIVAANIDADATSEGGKFENVEQGYYLIAETEVGNTADTFSLVMLDTAGKENITVATKESVPTVVKKVEEKNDSTGESSWGDSADHDLGDVINYKITGTVSDKYADYNSYYYSFSDTMVKGLTYNDDAKVYVVNGESKVDVTSQFDIVKTVGENDMHGFTATANLKELSDVTINANTQIIVEYTVTLNKDAVTGSVGNKNIVNLEYENNPYHKGDGNPDTPDKPNNPGKTPDDINIVFTYNTIVNKVDASGNALPGAGFTLYKWEVECDDEGVVIEDSGEWVAIGSEITGVTTFAFEKLDAGTYKLEETTVPDGYNKADDIEFVIETVLSDGDAPALTTLTVTSTADVTKDNGTIEAAFNVNHEAQDNIEAAVVNNAGTELPETGGMGTTIFYVVGGVMAAAAAILLITKKRLSNNA